MEHRYLAFDLETSKVQSPRRRDWMSRCPLGISCAATYYIGAKEPVLWYDGKRQKYPRSRLTLREAGKLVEYLCHKVATGYTIVTWNGIGFDFEVLAQESGMHAQCKSLALDHVDMMFHILCRLGFGVSLNAAARGMRLTRSCEKRTGALMPIFWADGRYEEVFRHVARDVRTSLALATMCRERGFVRWITRAGTGRMLLLPIGWQTVSVAQMTPEPPHHGRWSRASLTAWMSAEPYN